MDHLASNPAAAAAYRDGLAAGVLRYLRCTDCAAAQTLFRYACTRCGSTRLTWRDASGSGTVYATTIVTRAPTDAFRALAPYTLLLVDLDEGARLMAHGTPGLAIGDRVSAGFVDLAADPTPTRLVVFHPHIDMNPR